MDLNSLCERDRFIVSRWCYSIGSPVIEDAEYNLLREYMETNYPDDEYTQRSWSSDPCPVELLKKLGMENTIKKVMLADKTESIPSLNSYNDVNAALSNFCGSGTASMKHDGWNMQANYYNGKLLTVNSRGRTRDSVDTSVLMQLIPSTIPATGPIKIVFEATVSNQNFPFCVSMFGNVSQRSAVSSLLARPEYTYRISAHAFDVHGYQIPSGQTKFDVLHDWGFETPEWRHVYSYVDIIAALEELGNMKDLYSYPTDGMVVDGIARYALRIGAWEEPIYKSYITGYHEQFNLYRISPSLKIYPIMRKGGAQQRINITNWQRIFDYKLEPGSPVAFRLSSSVIADFDAATTALLQKQWAGKYDEFAERVRADEEVKMCQYHFFLQTL